MSLLRNVLHAAVLALAGCATAYDPNDWYDPNASEAMGKIVEKKVVAVDIRDQAGSGPPPKFLAIPLNSGMFFLVLSETREKAKIDIYEYVVETLDGKRTSVLSEYFAFEVGNCVKLFTSSRPSYPRIAYGYGCG